jgi:tetratricopeptide (TPR) repeat protein
VQNLVQVELNLHELAAARANLAEMPTDVDTDPVRTTSDVLQLGIEAEDWHGVLAHAGEMTAYLKTYPRNRHYTRVSLVPLLALAYANLGDFAAAERAIASMPTDCEPCSVMRGWIAELQHQRARADFWFARATGQAPSLPFSFHVWGRALLARGQPDAAIEKFKLASQKGPHFADPLEFWGEALMAKNQSHLALAKFAEAEKYAPNWGRLHLKWGEALVYAGKSVDAKAQFARAATLDLAPSEKAELARDSHG